VFPSAGFDNANALTGASNGAQPGHYLWGYYMIQINRADYSADVIPVRLAAGHWNVPQFLEKGPCTNCFKLDGVYPNPDGTLNVDVLIKHPFPNPNLTGFDVRGIAMFNGTHQFPQAGLAISLRTNGEGEVVNADGYTSLFNPTTVGHGFEGYAKGKLATGIPPSATLNGFKRFVTLDPANTRNAFYAGDKIVVTYRVDMPDPPAPWVFGYAVDASWSPPISKPVDDPMTDFGPEANCPEPWQISASSEPIGEGMTDQGGSVKLSIDVYDRQGNTSHKLPSVECPELFSDTLTADWISSAADHASYQVTVSNTELAPEGQYNCLIGVEDNENDTSPEWLDLTAYRIVSLPVIHLEKSPPVALASADPLTPGIGDPVQFSDNGSYDPDGGSITKFEWDWENDGIFDSEGAAAEHSWDTAGIYQVQFRVTDDEDQTDTLDQPLEIVVSEGHGWAQTWGGWGTETASDGAGHVYVAGFDGTPACIKKLDQDGNLVWEDLFEGGMTCDGVCVDNSGNVYTCGIFADTIDLDPGPGADSHTSNGMADMFLVKLDSDGNYLWGVTWGGDLDGSNWQYERALGVATDSAGSVFVVGLFRGVCDFDPGPGVTEYTSNGNASGAFDACVSKFDSSGQFLWARTWGGPAPIKNDYTAGDLAYGVATDTGDNVYVVGGFEGTVDFDPGAGVEEQTSSHPYGDIYLVKFNSQGDFVWVDTWNAIGYSEFPGTAQMWGGTFVSSDENGYIYVPGIYDGTTDFDPGPGLDEVDGSGMYLSKFDSTGSRTWTKFWPGSSLLMQEANAVISDKMGNLYVTGFFGEPTDFDPGSGVDMHSPLGWYDGYLCKLTEEGAFEWALTWGSPGGSDLTQSWGVCTDEKHFVYASGVFQGTVDFDPGPGVDEHTAFWGGCLTRYTPNGTW
jgi:hypothetical protein